MTYKDQIKNGLYLKGGETEIPILTLRRREAARALGISERTLFKLTAPRGPIRCVKTPKAVLYPLDELRAWLQAWAAESCLPAPPARQAGAGKKGGSDEPVQK